jgi:hypothetical protein
MKRTPEEEFAILYGGEPCEVVKADGSKHTIKVRHLGLRDLQRLSGVIQDPEAATALFCDLSIDEIRAISPDGQLALYEKGVALNFQRWERFSAKASTISSLIASRDIQAAQQALGPAGFDRILQSALKVAAAPPAVA